MKKIEIHYCSVWPIKKAMAASVAAQLSKENDLEVETAKGGLGEFSVLIDGQKVIDTNRLWYPTPGKVVAKVRKLLAGQASWGVVHHLDVSLGSAWFERVSFPLSKNLFTLKILQVQPQQKQCQQQHQQARGCYGGAATIPTIWFNLAAKQRTATVIA